MKGGEVMSLLGFAVKATVGTILGGPVVGIGTAVITELASNALENDGDGEAAKVLRLGMGAVDDAASSALDYDYDADNDN